VLLINETSIRHWFVKYRQGGFVIQRILHGKIQRVLGQVFFFVFAAPVEYLVQQRQRFLWSHEESFSRCPFLCTTFDAIHGTDPSHHLFGIQLRLGQKGMANLDWDDADEAMHG
jgi:hypothetical protein